MKCHYCKTVVEKKKGIFERDNVEYEYWQCPKCGEEFLDMVQLNKTAQKYRALRKAKEITFKKWGNSIAVRVPKKIADELKIKPEKHGLMINDKGALKIIPTY